MTQRITITDEGNLFVRPSITHEDVVQLAFKYFGLNIESETSVKKEFSSYDDRVYLFNGSVKGQNPKDYVIRVANSRYTKWKLFYEMIDSLLLHLNKEIDQYKFPKPVYPLGCKQTRILCKLPLQKDFQLIGLAKEQLENISEVSISLDKHGDKVYEIEHMVNMSEFIPGKTISHDEMNEKIAYEWGKLLACFHKAVKTFTLPPVQLRDVWLWNLLHGSKLLQSPYLSTIEDDAKKVLVKTVFDRFDTVTKEQLEFLPKQLIHSDANHENVIVNELNEVIGFIDFNDVVLSYAVVDLATVLAYALMFGSNEVALKFARSAYKGYISELPLNETELGVLFNLMQMRLCQSALIGEYQYKYLDPGNEYLMATPNTCWKRLEYLQDVGDDAILKLIIN